MFCAIATNTKNCLISTVLKAAVEVLSSTQERSSSSKILNISNLDLKSYLSKSTNVLTGNVLKVSKV